MSAGRRVAALVGGRTRLVLVVLLASVLVPPAAPAAAANSVTVSAPGYESPGGTVPVIVTLRGLPPRTTSVQISARSDGGAVVRCSGAAWINRARATASRTCYLTLPLRAGRYPVIGNAVALSGSVVTARQAGSGRSVEARGYVSGRPLDLATISRIERCGNTTSDVWLTFDDGASGTQLRSILSTLSRNDVRGRFLFTGAWRDSHPTLYRTLLTSGHLLANHSYDHPSLSALSSAQIAGQIRRGVAATTRPRLLRSPYGAGALTSRLSDAAAAQGYALCRWTTDTFDWDSASPSLMAERVRTGDYRTPPIAAGGNVLMHGTGRYTSAGGLQAVIDAVRARGLRLEPLRPAAA